MKKEFFCLACAGSMLLLTGCRETVMNPRQYKPCPAEAAPQAAPAVNDVSEPTAPAVKPAVQASAFKPMTGVSSSGGVEGKKSGKATATAGKAAAGTYIVQPGDTCGKIAYKNHVKLSALLKANNLTDTSAKRIRAGQKLVIPGGKATATAGKSVAKGKKAAKGNVSANVSGNQYTVVAGDFPQKIARKLNVKLSDLMAANNLDSDKASKLQIGQKLIIPGRGATVAKSGAPSKPVATDVDAVAPIDNATANQPQAATEQTLQPSTEQTVPTIASTDAAAPAENAQSNSDIMAITDSESVASTKDCTAEEFAREHNIPLEKLLQLNPDLSSGTDNIAKNRYVFVPKAEK